MIRNTTTIALFHEGMMNLSDRSLEPVRFSSHQSLSKMLPPARNSDTRLRGCQVCRVSADCRQDSQTERQQLGCGNHRQKDCTLWPLQPPIRFRWCASSQARQTNSLLPPQRSVVSSEARHL